MLLLLIILAAIALIAGTFYTGYKYGQKVANEVNVNIASFNEHVAMINADGKSIVNKVEKDVNSVVSAVKAGEAALKKL